MEDKYQEALDKAIREFKDCYNELLKDELVTRPTIELKMKYVKNAKMHIFMKKIQLK